ncbi:MAG: DNA-3-methyladenine glycosylase I [Acidobacteria bacterium]|nr:DNA-3-methyladenine glycosylase I [Acidobacteriota bacterium]
MPTASKLTPGPDGQLRCAWCTSAPDYLAYHDEEWGKPVHDDVRLFEKICLEGFQSGLSWLTILRKREGFRRAFAGFDFHQVARYTEADVERLLQDASIIRHGGKIRSTIHNAARAIELQAEAGSLDAYFWSFQSRTAEELARDLKRRGWTFVGPTTVYAFMQAMGLVTDHEPGCFLHSRGGA